MKRFLFKKFNNLFDLSDLKACLIFMLLYLQVTNLC